MLYGGRIHKGYSCRFPQNEKPGFGILPQNHNLARSTIRLRLKFLRASRRSAISEVLGVVLMVAMTLAVGAATWGYINGQARVSETLLGNSVGSTNNFLNERFSVIYFNFSSSAMSVWFYNSGTVSLYPIAVIVYDSAKTSIWIKYDASKVTDNLATCSITATSSLEKPTLYNAQLSLGQQVSGFANFGQGSISKLTLTIPSSGSFCGHSYSYSTGTTYYAQVIGLFGNTVTYFQTK